MHLVRERPLKRRKRKSLVGQSVLVLTSLFFMIVTAFTVIQVPICNVDNLVNFCQAKVYHLIYLLPENWIVLINQYAPVLVQEPKEYAITSYSLLAPFSIFLGYVLGPWLGVVAVAMFLCLGAFGPVFGFFPLAHGGGTEYFLEPTFGYLVGLLMASFVAGFVTQEKRTSLSQLLAVFLGLACIHISGVLYLFGTYLFFYLVEGSKNYLDWQPWIFQYVRNLTGNSLLYDSIFGIMFVGISFQLRWLVQRLTIPYNSESKNRTSYSRSMVSEVGVS